MAGFLLDTSCMIAAVCAWHEGHNRTVKEIVRRLNRNQKMIVAAPAIVEAYAVLTRLPPPYRLSPADAHVLIEGNFMGATRMVALDGKSYRVLLRQARDNGVAGGQVYDAVIAACALKAKAEALLTFNEGDFIPFASGGMEIVVPPSPLT